MTYARQKEPFLGFVLLFQIYAWNGGLTAFDVESQLYLTTPSVADGDIRHGHDLLLDPASSALFRLQLIPRLGITYESLRQEEYDNISGQCGGA